MTKMLTCCLRTLRNFVHDLKKQKEKKEAQEASEREETNKEETKPQGLLHQEVTLPGPNHICQKA